MKGLVLAGGTATRLFPLTIVTNKHLLPIYDRPMIYYPLDTLAGMGIREVMVIVGGKSVGDIVELLGDGRHFGLDLTYRYQRGALGIAHAIGLARDFIGDDSFCVVLGDNILRGPALEPIVRTFDTGPWGAGTLLYRVSDPQRFGVAELDARRQRRRVRGEAGQAEVGPDPDRRLLPAPGRVRRHRDARAVRPRRVRDHRRPQPLHPEGRAVHAGLRGPLGRCGHRAVAPAGRRARRGGCRRRHAGGAAGPSRRGPDDGRRSPADAHLLVTGGAGFIGSELVRRILGRRDGARITVLDKLTYAGNRANLAAVEADPEQAASIRVRPGRHRRRRGRRAARRAASTPSSTSPPRRTSTARSSTPRRSCGPASSGSTCCSRPCAARRTGHATASAHGRRDSSRSAPTRSTARSPRAAASRPTRSPRAARTPRPRRRASCSSAPTT